MDDAVFGEDACGGAELADLAAGAEEPAGDAELVVAGVDPVAGVLDETEEVFADGDVAVGGEEVGQDTVRLAAERAPAEVPEILVEIVERLVDDGRAQDARRLPRLRGEGGGIERDLEEFVPLGAVVPVERQFAGAAPDLDALDEAGAQGGQPAAEGRLGVRPVETIEAKGGTPVDAGAQVDALGTGAGVEPAGDFQPGGFRPPVGGAVNVEAGRGGGGHATGPR